MLADDIRIMIKNNRYKIGSDGTRYYLLSQEELEDIVEALEGESE